MLSMLSLFRNRSAMKYSTYFVHGTDNRPLSSDALMEISEFVSQDPTCNSFFVYNKTDTKVKLTQWNNKLKWVEPYYSMKTNPIT